MDDEFRVEVELDDAEHGFSAEERLRAAELDDAARDRLGQGVLVTREGSRIFLYAATKAAACEAERVIRELVVSDELTAEIAVTRWHPIEEAWKDAALPLPTTPSAEEAEQEALERAETREAELEGAYDWHVVVQLPARDDAVELADRLAGEGFAVRRRWRYLTIGVPTEERAAELAARVRTVTPAADVRVEVDLSDVARSPLQFLPLQFLPF